MNEPLISFTASGSTYPDLILDVSIKAINKNLTKSASSFLPVSNAPIDCSTNDFKVNTFK